MVKRQPTIYLTAGEVLTFNREILRRAGTPAQAGAFLRERGLLESAVQRPQNAAYYAGADLVTQAALYMVGIALNHPFVDGNKRTGLLAGATLLYLAGYDLAVPRKEMVEVAIALAERKIGVEEISRWFEVNARRRE